MNLLLDFRLSEQSVCDCLLAGSEWDCELNAQIVSFLMHYVLGI